MHKKVFDPNTRTDNNFNPNPNSEPDPNHNPNKLIPIIFYLM